MLIRWIGILSGILIALPLASCATQAVANASGGNVVTVTPGQNLPDIVAKSPDNTVFVLSPGVYRGHYIAPRNGQRFIGKDGAILNGAIVLKNWTKEGNYWVSETLPPPLKPHGYCLKKSPACRFREDLFVNNEVYKRVLDRVELGPKTWYYYENKAYLTADPNRKLVELSVAPRAIGGKGANVVFQNLTVEKYASQSQTGAIDARHGRNWSFVDVTARWNHGIGLYVGTGTSIKNGTFSHNGQMGLGGYGDGIVIDGPEIAYNNYAGFGYSWEAGGFKFVWSRGMIVRNACVHHNDGVGMWNDIDNIDTLFENNKVFDNVGLGIAQEISYAATIRNNIVARNGSRRDNWLWGSQIFIQNSQGVKVYGNVVEIAPTYGNGIGIVHQDRGEGKYGRYASMNNHIYDNQIIHLGNHGRNGLAADFEREWFHADANNRIEGNTYVLPSAESGHWMYKNRTFDWKGVQEGALEKGSRLVIEQRQPMKLSCGN